jgi:hypothetical protein
VLVLEGDRLFDQLRRVWGQSVVLRWQLFSARNQLRRTGTRPTSHISMYIFIYIYR